MQKASEITDAVSVSRATIAETCARIAPAVRRTPVIEVAVPGVAAPVSLKLEFLQHTGSFKPRGAFANLMGADIPAAGVAAASVQVPCVLLRAREHRVLTILLLRCRRNRQKSGRLVHDEDGLVLVKPREVQAGVRQRPARRVEVDRARR